MEAVRSFSERMGLVLEGFGVAVIVVAAVYSSVLAGWRYFRRGEMQEVYRPYRHQLGRGILLGLEFLVAGDIIGTVAVEPSLTSLAILAGIVLIRTFLSFTLEVEMTGRWPWQGRSGEEKL